MKELRFKANNGAEISRAAFAFDPQRRAIILVAADKQGIDEGKFYKTLLKTAIQRFDRHLADQKTATTAKPKKRGNIMGRKLDDIIKSLPADRQAKIETPANEKVEEMIACAATLTDFRKALGKTQVEVAKVLGIKQNAVSQLEKRSDTYVSTLRRFMNSLGLTLEMSVVDKNGSRIDLPNFLPWFDTNATLDVSHPGDGSIRPATGKSSAKSVAARRRRAKSVSVVVAKTAQSPIRQRKK